MQLSKGKIRHLKSLSNGRGVIAAAAMDQRGALRKMIAKEQNAAPEAVTPEAMIEFKTAVTRLLTPHATAILLDPELGLPASKVRAGNAGLLLAYEKSGYDNKVAGRLPDLLPDVSARRIKQWGGNAVKILIYYTPLEAPEINEIKHAFIERIGAECEAEEIPFFLEFVGYDPKEGDEKSLEYARAKPRIVIQSMEEFSKPHYRVDVLKVEVPINARYVEGSKVFGGQKAYSWSEALDLFRQAAAAARAPFIYLSAGVSNEQFTESLRMASEAGTDFSGVLCGRATWQDGVGVYARQGLAALEDWLSTKGVANIEAVNESLKPARPWYAKLGLTASALN